MSSWVGRIVYYIVYIGFFLLKNVGTTKIELLAAAVN